MVANFRERIQARAEDLAARSARALERIPPFKAILEQRGKLLYPLLALLGFLSADLALQLSAGHLSKLAGRARPVGQKEEIEKPYVKGFGNFEETIRRTPFCPGCPVPDIKALMLSRPKDCSKAKLYANASNIKVIGTIVLSNPIFSVATITSGGGESLAIKKGDTVSGFGTVFEIRRNRICFEKADGFLGFIDIPEERVNFGQPLASALPASSFEGITRTSDNEVEIKRSFLLEKLNDPQILFQAHAVPYRDPQSGLMKGFKVLSVVPGSVYDAMDIKGDDVIVEVNGEPMNALNKAQELYSGAASADTVTVGILRGGQTIQKVYKVK